MTPSGSSFADIAQNELNLSREVESIKATQRHIHYLGNTDRILQFPLPRWRQMLILQTLYRTDSNLLYHVDNIRYIRSGLMQMAPTNKAINLTSLCEEIHLPTCRASVASTEQVNRGTCSSHFLLCLLLERKLCQGPFAAVISFSWTLPQSKLFPGYVLDMTRKVSLRFL